MGSTLLINYNIYAIDLCTLHLPMYSHLSFILKIHTCSCFSPTLGKGDDNMVYLSTQVREQGIRACMSKLYKLKAQGHAAEQIGALVWI